MKFAGTPFKPVRRTWRQISRRKGGLPCDGCNKTCVFGIDYYMVGDNVWRVEARLPVHGCMLCIRCLTTRLGRVLVREDFTDCILNDRIRESLTPTQVRS